MAVTVSMPRKAAQPGHRFGVARLVGQVLEVLLERSLARLDLLDGEQVVLEHHPLRRALERLRPEPGTVPLGPTCVRALTEHPPAPQQELAEPVPRPHQVEPRVVAPATEIANGFLVFARRPHHGQQLGPCHLGQLACVATVRLDPLPGPDRDHRRCDHVTAQLRCQQLSL